MDHSDREKTVAVLCLKQIRVYSQPGLTHLVSMRGRASFCGISVPELYRFTHESLPRRTMIPHVCMQCASRSVIKDYTRYFGRQ